MKPFTRKQHYLVLLVLTALTILIRLPFAGPYLYDGDPVVYYEGAVNLLHDGQYLVDGKVPFWPAGTSLTMAPLVAVFELLGWPMESAAFWHGLMFMIIAVTFTYLLGKWLFSPATGMIGAVLLTLAESPFLHSINAAADIGAMAMLVASVYFILLFLDTQTPRDLFLSFFLLGFSFLFRWNYALFLPLYLVFLIGDRRIWAFHLYPKFWILGFTGFFLGVAIQFWFNFQHYGSPFQIGYGQLDYETQFKFQILVLVKNMVRVVYRVLFTWDFYSPLLAMFGVLAVVSLYQKKRRDVLWLFLPWVVLGALSVIYFGVKPRLLIPIMPPLFLIGAEGVVWLYMRLSANWPGLRKTRGLGAGLFGLMALILFLPMFSRTLLHAHGHFQEKMVMQAAFRWAGEQSPENTILITQPMYAGQNDDWLRAGWRHWASRRYSGRETVSFRYPATWAAEPDQNLLVVNQFWFEAENMRFEDTDRLAGRFDSLKAVWNLELLAIFEGQHEPTWLKKFNMLSYYPVDFMVFRPRFEIWGPSR